MCKLSRNPPNLFHIRRHIQKITSQIGDALDYAHSQGIVHRDIKPSNVLIDERGNCLLADFGIAKMVEGTSQFTQTGGNVGTPAYMSPEQGLGTKPDGRSDIYSLGIILYEMATGRPPYHAETPIAVVIKHIHDPLPPPRTVNPQISDTLERIILKALANNREERYWTCGELVHAIQAMETIHPTSGSTTIEPSPVLATLIESPVESAPQVDSPPSVSTPPTPPAYQITEQSLQRPKWIPWAITAGIFGFGLIAILAIWFIFTTFFNRPEGESDLALLIPTATASILEAIQPTQTNTPVPAVTETPASTEIPTQTPEPTLGIGDTLISQVDGAVMAYIPAGEFLLGAGNNDPNADTDETPQVTVYLDAFWLDKFEVTNRQYQTCVTAGVCAPPADFESATRYKYYSDPEFDDHPVINVTWSDAAAYCQWRDARLPTEAEWEKAARGGSGNIYPWGDTFEDMHSNYCASTILCPDEPEDGFIDTAPVGSFPAGASPYGAYDMAGNVNEWVADWYDPHYYISLESGTENPTGPEVGDEHGIRGGSAGLNATKLRTTNRGAAKSGSYGYYGGFRCAQTP